MKCADLRLAQQECALLLMMLNDADKSLSTAGNSEQTRQLKDTASILRYKLECATEDAKRGYIDSTGRGWG
jgi:hypothetical protein